MPRSRIVVLAGAACLVACGPPSAPDLSTLSLRSSYVEVAALAGGECERIHDRGIRMLEWRYDDGSWIEATIHSGHLSGLEVVDPDGSYGRSVARAKLMTVQPDMHEDGLRKRLGDSPTVLEDDSDRECRWTWGDGALTALFERGELRNAEWQPVDAPEPVVLVEVTDEVALSLRDLRSEHSWDRFRALEALKGSRDPRLADALVDLLRVETVASLRGKAARMLVSTGDRRGSDLLLADLSRNVIPDDILEALGAIGDRRALEELDQAHDRSSSPRTRRKIRATQRRIKSRLD